MNYKELSLRWVRWQRGGEYTGIKNKKSVYFLKMEIKKYVFGKSREFAFPGLSERYTHPLLQKECIKQPLGGDCMKNIGSKPYKVFYTEPFISIELLKDNCDHCPAPYNCDNNDNHCPYRIKTFFHGSKKENTVKSWWTILTRPLTKNINC